MGPFDILNGRSCSLFLKGLKIIDVNEVEVIAALLSNVFWRVL